MQDAIVTFRAVPTGNGQELRLRAMFHQGSCCPIDIESPWRKRRWDVRFHIMIPCSVNLGYVQRWNVLQEDVTKYPERHEVTARRWYKIQERLGSHYKKMLQSIQKVMKLQENDTTYQEIVLENADRRTLLHSHPNRPQKKRCKSDSCTAPPGAPSPKKVLVLFEKALCGKGYLRKGFSV